jgi:sulfur-carrier protein
MTDVRVLLFARLRELAGTDAITVRLTEPATAGDLRRAVAAMAPALADWLPRCAVAINGAYAEELTVIARDAEAALLPPVSGG